MKQTRALWLFACVLLVNSPALGQRTATRVDEIVHSANAVVGRFYRTELYFGRSIPGGGTVSDEEWERFLADVVTPRFPDGFTIINATGQSREKDGTLDKERTEILVFFYPVNDRTASRRKIEEIRRAYVKQFKQESVLRLDYPSTVNVLFK